MRAQGGATWAELNDARRRARARGDGRRGVEHRRRGTDARRRPRLADGPSHGLAADNLVEVELVDCRRRRCRRVDEASDPDLFWALRGGGGNFGVATALTFRVQPLATVTGGLIAHPIEAAPELLRFYRDAVAEHLGRPDRVRRPRPRPGRIGMKLAALVVCHAGTPEEADRELAPFIGFGSPAVVQVGRMPYPVMNTMLDAGYPAGSLNYWLSSFTDGLSDELIDTAVERFTTVPVTDDRDPVRALPRRRHPCRARPPPPCPHRERGWNLVLPSVWTDPAATEANIAWTRETFAALRPAPRRAAAG